MGDTVIVSMSRAFNQLEYALTRSLLQMPLFRQDHFVAFAQGIRVPPALMEGLKADLASTRSSEPGR